MVIELNKLFNLAFQKQALVEIETKDRYGRTIGVVFVDGQNVNTELIRQGMAWHGFTGNTLMMKGFIFWNQKRNKLNVGFG